MYDYCMEDLLVQFRIPRVYGPRLRVAANVAGISATALPRQVVMRRLDQESPIAVRAWTLPEKAANRHASVRDVQRQLPKLFLAPVEQVSATQRTFQVFRKEEGGMRRWTVSELRAHDVDWFADLPGYRFVLAGGSVWRPVVPMEMDRGDGPALEVTMQLEKP